MIKLKDKQEIILEYTGKRAKRVLTDEVIDRIKFYLKENENKQLNGLSKQQKRKKIYMKP